MILKSARALIGAAFALTAQSTWPFAARSDEALFKSYCVKCHSRAQPLARRLPGKSPEEKSALLATFLETHHPPQLNNARRWSVIWSGSASREGRRWLKAKAETNSTDSTTNPIRLRGRSRRLRPDAQ
jgi:hypothetical protein